MLLQTNSYVVPRERRADHARLMKRFKQVMHRLGCDSFEVYEQSGPHWAALRSDTRCVQVLRFRDRQQFQALQQSERNDEQAQQIIAEFSVLVELPGQLANGLFFTSFFEDVADGDISLPAPQ